VEQWTLTDLVTEAAAHIAKLPAPKNGQVRAVPDDRTIRYYGTIGLLDKPSAMRGRTALYNRRHLAQVVAIKRLQTMGRSLAEIQTLWPTLDEHTLARMSGIALGAAGRAPARKEFWKREPATIVAPTARSAPSSVHATAPVELRLELTPHVAITIAMPDGGIALSHADVRAIRAAAAPLVAELAARQLTPQPGEEGP
jgi:DNA-binding transcriptional MerR regulator